MLEMDYTNMNLLNLFCWVHGVCKYASTLFGVINVYKSMQTDVEEYDDFMETLLNNLASLVTAKSLMAICLTIVFCVAECTVGVSSDFMSLYAIVIGFYFGQNSTDTTNLISYK